MKVILITRYNEYIDWIKYIIGKVDKIVIYNKGSNDILYKDLKPTEEMFQKISIIKLPNVGRIDHSLAYYILENWENLPDILINLPGSIMICQKKGYYLESISKRLNLIDRYKGFYAPRFHKVNANFNYNIDNYQPEGRCNKNNNPFIKSTFNNFQEWKKELIDDLPMKYVGMRGMFMVSKENIKFINKQIYINLSLSLSVGDNIENGHFAERIWAHLFTQKSLN